MCFLKFEALGQEQLQFWLIRMSLEIWLKLCKSLPLGMPMPEHINELLELITYHQKDMGLDESVFYRIKGSFQGHPFCNSLDVSVAISTANLSQFKGDWLVMAENALETSKSWSEVI